MRWSVVIPVFNERDYLPATLRSLAAQSRPFRLILVDNASTDGGIDVARSIIREGRLDAVILREESAGQVHALKRGIDAVDTELVAICDADTWYPPHYLAQAEALFDSRGPGCVAAAALLLPADRNGLKARFKRGRQLAAARLMPRQNHTSGAAQCFRLEALRQAGGYDARIWPYVLKDHELMHRVLTLGSQAYHPQLWCHSSDRRKNRRNVRWTLAERIAYHLTPFTLKDRFFNAFLAPRFAARGLGDVCLRQRSWDEPPEQQT